MWVNIMNKLIRHIFLLSIVLVFLGNAAFTQCNAPTLQPTNLALTSTLTTIAGTFTSEPSADNYLIIRSTISSLSAVPISGTIYSDGDTLGGGFVVKYSVDTMFLDINLNSGTQYYYYVFAANSLSCTGGPAYLLTSPLIGNATCSLKSLNITAILQEYYNYGTGLMNQTQGMNWNTGDLFDNFGSIIVDTVTVFIRSTKYPNYVIEATYNGVNLNTNGSIPTIYLNSNWNACPYGEITGYHYIVIKHRNSIETWSDSVDFTVQQINYNFFTHTPVQFADGIFEDATGNFEIWGGDVNQNGNLESEDCTQIYLAAISDDETVNNGYVINDIDGNGNVDSEDYGLAFENEMAGANTINPLIYPAQPTGLALTPNYSTVTGSFSASVTADHYLIVRSTSSTLSALPAKGTAYTAGNTIGNGIVIAYQIGTSFTDTSVNYGTQYYYIFASDTLYCTHSYLTTSPLTGNVFLNCGIPIDQPTNLTLSNNGNSISGSFTASASADHYLIVRSTIDPLTANPINGTTYTAGNSLGGGIIVADQTGTTFTDTNVNPGIQYYYNVFAANCTGSPQFLTINPLKATNGYNCESAITIYPTDSVKLIQIPITDTTYWVKFVATDTSIYFCMHIIRGDTGTVNQMTLYNAPDNCNAYTQVSTINGIYLHFGNLTIGNTYLLKREYNGTKLIFNELAYYKGSNKAAGTTNSDFLHGLPPEVCVGTLAIFDPPITSFYGYSVSFPYGGDVIFWNGTYKGLYFGTPTQVTIVIGIADGSGGYSTTTYHLVVTLSPHLTVSGNCSTINFVPSTCLTDPTIANLTYQYSYIGINGTLGSGGSTLSSIPNWTCTFTPGDYKVTLTIYCAPFITSNMITCTPVIAEFEQVSYTFTISNATVQFNPTSPQTIYTGCSLPITAFVQGVNIPDGSCLWSVSGSQIETNPDITVSPTVNTTYTVVATDELGCTHTGDFVVNVTPPTPISINGSLNDNCHKLGVFNVVSPQPNITYSWTVPATILSHSVSTTNNTDNYSNDLLNVSWGNVTGVDYISVIGTDNATGCVVYQGQIQVDPTLGDPVEGIITMSGSFNDNCHQQGIYTVDNAQSGVTYSWTILPFYPTPSNPPQITLSSTGTSFQNQATLSWNNAPANYIYVTGVDASGCTIYQGLVWIDPSTAPSLAPIAINGSLSDCPYSGIFNVVSPVNGVTYSWSVPTGATTTPNTGTSTTVSWGTAIAGNITVSYTDASGCVYTGTYAVDPFYCMNNPIVLNSLNAYDINAVPNLNSYNFVITNNSNYIVFNGVTTINHNLTFTGCPNIRFGVNARINVMPGFTLTFEECNLQQACDCPWDGIYAEDPTAEIIIKSKSTVRDAKNAIVSNNGGNFNITSTWFINNLVALWVHNYNPPWIYDFLGNQFAPPAHQGYIASSTITKDNSFGYYSTINPKPLTGIIVDTVYNLTIGDLSNLSYENNFSYLQWGIKTKKSDVYIYNNSFTNIYLTDLTHPSYSGNGEPNEAAIFCKTEVETIVQPSMPITNKVNIGNSTSYGYGPNMNRINTSNTGIYANHVQMDIRGNWIFDITHNCIHIKDFSNPSVINYNDANQNTGVYDITDNLRNYIIVAEQTNTNATVTLDINSNRVGIVNDGYLRSGILARNCNGTLYGTSHCIIQNNVFYYPTSTLSALYCYGISAYNCNYAKITGTTFDNENMPYPNQNDHQRLFGIYLNLTKNAKISTNQIMRMGDGIYVKGWSLGSQFFCNDLDKCWYGIYFANVQLSSQLINPTPFGNNRTSDNYWYDDPIYNSPPNSTDALRRVSGTLSNYEVNWFHQGPINSVPNIYSSYVTTANSLNGFIVPVQNQSPNSDCSSIFDPNSNSNTEKSLVANTLTDTTTNTVDTIIVNAALRDQLMGKIVKDTATYIDLPVENKYMAKEFAYKLLDEIPAYLNLGTSEDIIYQNFYDSVNNSNIGKLYQIGKYINTKNYSAANSLNLTLTGTNTIENYRITVNNIYLNKVVNNEFLGESDSLTLLEIANQHTLTAGDAVISARVILGIDPFITDDDSIGQTKSIRNQEIAEKSAIKVYPNPANDKLYIELDNTMDGMANVEFYDLTGKLIYNTTVNAAKKLQMLNVSNIKAGIYNLRITTTDKTFNQKLVIIK